MQHKVGIAGGPLLEGKVQGKSEATLNGRYILVGRQCCPGVGLGY